MVFLLSFLLAAAPPSFAPGQVVKWNPVTTNILGGPTVIGGYELVIVPAGTDLNVSGVPLATIPYGPDAWTGLNIDPLLSALVSGGYSLQVRARNASGFWGPWSAPLTRQWDSVPPAAPDGVGVR